MPPHFDGKWFVTDWKKNIIKAFTLNDQGTSVTAEEELLKLANLTNPVEFEEGPDGAFYLINYAGNRTFSANTSIIRLEYTGTCTIKPAPISRLSKSKSNRKRESEFYDLKGQRLPAGPWDKLNLQRSFPGIPSGLVIEKSSENVEIRLW